MRCVYDRLSELIARISILVVAGSLYYTVVDALVTNNLFFNTIINKL